MGGFLSILELLIGVFICLFNSSSLGIPGIGGVFLGIGVLPIVLGSGIPGIGVAPFGKTAGPGIAESETELLVTVIGLPESPGGIVAEVFAFDKLTAFVFVLSTDWQARFNVSAQENKIKKAFFNIK